MKKSKIKTILLAEDDALLIDIYSMKLREAGFRVEIAKDGEEVLKKIKEKIPDLLLLDIVLPGISGWEILEKIRGDQSFKKLKIVILSNLGQKNEVERGLKLGADKYLIKAHYTPSQIVKEIKEVLK